MFSTLQELEEQKEQKDNEAADDVKKAMEATLVFSDIK